METLSTLTWTYCATQRRSISYSIISSQTSSTYCDVICLRLAGVHLLYYLVEARALKFVQRDNNSQLWSFTLFTSCYQLMLHGKINTVSNAI